MNYIDVPFPFTRPGIIGWCKESIGPGRWVMGNTHSESGDVWRATRVGNSMRFEFKNESDATMFSLRWS